MHGRSSKAQRGATLILLTLALSLVVIPLMGIAVDGTTLYLVRIKLSQAVDAAALGGARSLSTGLDLASQTSSATSTALTYLNANFPAGLMGASYSGTPTVTIAQDTTVTRTVLVQASVAVPTTFMRVAGFRSTTVSATGQATRRDVNLMLVVDRSNSMQLAGVCSTMVANAQAFVSKFSDGRDILGLITFTHATSLDFPPSSSFKSGSPSLTSVLGNLKCGGNTSSAQGLWEGYLKIKEVNQPGRLNVILFFTDGNPNGVYADFQVKRSTDTRYISTSINQQVASPPSPCATSVTLMRGVIARGSPVGPTGYTTGVFDPVSTGISDTSNRLLTSSNCAFTSDWTAMSSDVAAIPNQDHYLNATTGYQTSILFPTGSPYAGRIRPDTPASIAAASINAADNAARTIRADTRFNIVIFSLGLGGTSTEALDTEFLRRVANDPQASNYDPSRPAGHYYYAADITQLGAAYEAIASQILRLSK